MKQNEVVDLMSSSKSKEEWGQNCDAVKKACGGYPDFWYEAIISTGLADKVLKQAGSSADITVTGFNRSPIPHLHGRPTAMPYLSPNQRIVGEYDQGLGKKDLICGTLEDMQRLYDSYASGMALSLNWYIETETSEVLAAPVA